MKRQNSDLLLQELNGKKVLVLGLGIQGGGLGVVRFLLRHGAKVTIYDDKNSADLDASLSALSKEEGINYLFGGRKPDNIKDYFLIVKGPSVKWDHEVVKLAQNSNVRITMETALFVSNAKCKVVGVTGTRGKSTTTLMIYQVLSELYKSGKVYLSGNLPGTCSLDLLDKVTDNDIVVLELSSWQLSGFHHEKCSPDVAVLTTLYEDHMNYYSNLHDYIYDKTAIYAYQNENDKIIISRNFVKDFFDVTKPNHNNIVEVKTDSFVAALVHLKGLHNILNASLAKEACKAILGSADDAAIENIIASQKHISCRQEFLATFKNVEIINDSASTTPIATITALDTFSDKDIVLILGGKSKNLSFDGLVDKIYSMKEKIKCIYLLKGSFTDEIMPVLSAKKGMQLVGAYDNFEKAVSDAFEKSIATTSPTYLLFSPGATSFAQFKNEFHRGKEFERIVSDIMNK